MRSAAIRKAERRVLRAIMGYWRRYAPWDDWTRRNKGTSFDAVVRGCDALNRARAQAQRKARRSR